jgi:hypothetical protein
VSKKLYVVLRVSWEIYDGSCDHHEEWAGKPVAVFRTKQKADAHCRALEEQARREVSPVQFFDEYPERVSKYDADQIVEKLAALGLPVPREIKKKSRFGSGTYTDLDWHGWWDQLAPELTDKQMKAVWNLFTDLKFYQVVQTEEKADL